VSIATAAVESGVNRNGVDRLRVMEMDMWRGTYVRRVERSEDVSEV
jgi:hypothetical protein